MEGFIFGILRYTSTVYVSKENLAPLAAPRARSVSRTTPTPGGGVLPIMAYTGKLGPPGYLFHASGI